MEVLLAGSLDEAELAQWLVELQAALPEARFRLDPSPDIEVAVVANPPPGALQGLPRLQLIQSLWAGVDRLLADPTLPAGVPVARMVDPAMSRAMAETALWAVLSLHRGFFGYRRQQLSAQWLQHPQLRADEVAVAVLGLGEMGRTVARALQQQGYDVAGWRQQDADPGAPWPVFHGEAGLQQLLSRSDVVVNLLPLTPPTRGLFDARRLGWMKRGAGLVNLARGAHVVDEDLLQALDDTRVGHAVLDVFPAEPLPPAHRYWSHPQVTVLPHVAAQTDPRSASRIVADNLRAWREGRPVSHLVDRGRGY